MKRNLMILVLVLIALVTTILITKNKPDNILERQS